MSLGTRGAEGRRGLVRCHRCVRRLSLSLALWRRIAWRNERMSVWRTISAAKIERRRRLRLVLWAWFDPILGVLYKVLHQGGVVPSLIDGGMQWCVCWGKELF